MSVKMYAIDNSWIFGWCNYLKRSFLIWAQPIREGVTKYRQVSNISRTLVGSKIVDHADVVGASPVGAAPTTSSFST